MSSGSTTWTAGPSRRSSRGSKAGPSGSRPSPPPWARIPVRSKRCTSRFSCNAASWPARRAAAAPLEPRTSILGSLRPEPRTSKRSSTGRQSRYRTSDFNYSLPAGRIAQHPLPDRAASRLLVLDRSTGAIRHARFRDIVELVAPEDVLVLNVSRVIPARLHGKWETGNVAELLVVDRKSTRLNSSHLGISYAVFCLKKKKKKKKTDTEEGRRKEWQLTLET